jgi:hypothetical protein
VLDLDPLISGFGLRLKNFGWDPSFLVELGCDSIPSDLVRLRAQVLGHSIPKGCFTSPLNLSSRAKDVWVIHGRIGDLVLAFSSSSCTVRTWLTVCAWPADRPQGGQQPVVLRVLREFVRCILLIRSVGRFWLDVVGRTVHPMRPDYPR